MFFVVVALLLLFCISKAFTLKDVETNYGVVFLEEERALRQQILKDNLQFIETENSKNHTYTLGITRFIYLSQDEFIHMTTLRGYSTTMQIERTTHSNCVQMPSVPQTVDWRKKGIFSPIRNQGTCGSCYGEAAAELTASILRLSGNSVDQLSLQQIVDCSQSYGNSGCSGGSILFSMRYIIDNGLVTETSYPYRGKSGVCSVDDATRYRVQNSTTLVGVSESTMQVYVSQSPVAVGILSSWAPLQHYRSGVLSGHCHGAIDHAVLVVGYGEMYTQANEAIPYWILRNSWGCDWGEGGYFRLERNTGGLGMCDIGTTVSLAVASNLCYKQFTILGYYDEYTSLPFLVHLKPQKSCLCPLFIVRVQFVNGPSR